MRKGFWLGGFLSFVAVARAVYEIKLAYGAIVGGVKKRNKFIRYMFVCFGRYCSMAVGCILHAFNCPYPPPISL